VLLTIEPPYRIVCGRFTQADPRQLAIRFDLAALAELPARFNVAPTQPVPIITGPGAMVLARWGLVPSWAKDLSIGSRLINARAETLEAKSAFREALRTRRCLVPADGFFEWKKEGRQRRPFYFRLPDGAPFAFAGLWATWRDPAGQPVTSFTIVTTEPNALLAPVHDRMPVILLPGAEARWLDPSTKDLADLLDLMQPYPSHEMEGFEVAPVVNNVANDVPACIEPA
jgi:putative SOS response-associated peptidase YedK